MKKAKKKSRTITAGGVSEYIAKCPKVVQSKLKDIRSAIRSVVPDAIPIPKTLVKKLVKASLKSMKELS